MFGMGAYQPQSLRLTAVAAHGVQHIRQPFRLVDDAEAAAPAQQIRCGSADIFQRTVGFGPGSVNRFICCKESAVWRIIRGIADNEVKTSGRKVIFYGSQILMADGELCFQVIGRNCLLCQRNGGCLNFNTCYSKCWLALQKEKTEQAGSAAQITYPQTGF